MEEFNIYKDIATRTGGDIYIGVVGPVRTGKSTFIKRFMDLLVVPNIEDEYSRERATDELPQSAAGKTIMTTEPKFVPNEAVEINLGENASCNVRLIDCVGYLIPGANGHMDEGEPRMITTPWAEEKLPFEVAAEMGTKKVINDHSTIGIVVTTDGSITEIERENYLEAEARVVNELKALGKPFVMLLNSSTPFAPRTEEVRKEVSEKYGVPVTTVNCAQLKAEDINAIMEQILYEFPVKEVKLNFPKWIETLSLDHWLKASLLESVKEMLPKITKLSEVKAQLASLNSFDYVKKAFVDAIKLGTGTASLEISMDDDLFYKVLSETTGMEITSEYELISKIKILAEAKHEYDKVQYALDEVHRKGYGIVTPSLEEMKLEEPVLVKHGNRYGVKIKATAPSIHLIKADIETEISPIVGSEEQSQDLINYINNEMNGDASKIWEVNMFGKTMHDLVNDGLQNKLYRMPEDAQVKFQDTIQKIINEGNGGIICILL